MNFPTNRVGSDSRRIVKSRGASAIHQPRGDPNFRQIRRNFSLLAISWGLNLCGDPGYNFKWGRIPGSAEHGFRDVPLADVLLLPGARSAADRRDDSVAGVEY